MFETQPTRPETVSLVVPGENLMEAYLDFCRASWGKVHDSYILDDPDRYEEWRHTRIRDYLRAEQGIGLPPGIVPSVTFWIFLSRRMIGICNFRPVLNERLERYGGHIGLVIRPECRGRGYGRSLIPMLLERARQLGIQELLLTCEAANTASVRLSEAFPGSHSEYAMETLHGELCRIHRTRVKLQ